MTLQRIPRASLHDDFKKTKGKKLKKLYFAAKCLVGQRRNKSIAITESNRKLPVMKPFKFINCTMKKKSKENDICCLNSTLSFSGKGRKQVKEKHV